MTTELQLNKQLDWKATSGERKKLSPSIVYSIGEEGEK